MRLKSKINVPGSDQIFNSILKDKNVIVFGTGNFGSIVLKGLSLANINVIGFGDNNENNWGKKWQDKEIFSLEV